MFWDSGKEDNALNMPVKKAVINIGSLTLSWTLGDSPGFLAAYKTL